MRTITKFTKGVVAIAAIGVVGTTAAACSSDPSPIADVKTISGTSTSVALDSAFGGALASLKVAAAPVGKASFDAATSTLTFPITGGNVKVYKKGDVTPYVQGSILHKGSGFSLKAGSTTVSLTNFIVDPGNNSNIKGDVAVNGKTAATDIKLFDLNGGTLKPITVDSSGVATLTGTQVLLGDDAAKLLNTTFKITALKGQLLIGIATLKVNTK